VCDSCVIVPRPSTTCYHFASTPRQNRVKQEAKLFSRNALIPWFYLSWFVLVLFIFRLGRFEHSKIGVVGSPAAAKLISFFPLYFSRDEEGFSNFGFARCQLVLTLYIKIRRKKGDQL